MKFDKKISEDVTCFDNWSDVGQETSILYKNRGPSGLAPY